MKRVEKKLRIQKLLSIVAIVLGAVLMVFMIIVEDEPGGIPILLIVFGTLFFIRIHSKLRTQAEQFI